MILVNSANGQQGKLLVPKLIKAGLRVRACVQSEGSAAELRAAGVADVIVGDIGDLDVVAQAIRGVEKVYHICGRACRPPAPRSGSSGPVRRNAESHRLSGDLARRRWSPGPRAETRNHPQRWFSLARKERCICFDSASSHFPCPMSATGARVCIATAAFLLLMIVEPVLGVYGFGRGWAEQIFALAQPAGLLGLAGQILFAVSPLMRHRERLQDRAI